MVNNNTLLITGITGFVGLNLCSFLKKKNYNIQGISRTASKDSIAYNSLSSDLWNKSFGMIHLAGKAHDLNNTSLDKEYFEANTELTKKLFDQFLESSSTKFIYISSVKAVADVVEGILTEEKIPNPITVYGKSKLAAEQYIMSKQLPENKKIYILRPCMIHGPGNKGNLNLLYKVVEKGIPYPLGAFNNSRSFLSISNLNYIVNNILEKDIPSGIYNVADDNPMSTNELIGTICDALDRKPRIWNLSQGFIKFIAKTGDLLHLPLNTFRLNKLTENYVVSNSKIKEQLKIETLPTSAVEGIKKTIQSFIQ